MKGGSLCWNYLLDCFHLVKVCHQRKMQTEAHSRVWLDFEKVLDMRARMYYISITVINMSWYFMGRWRPDMSLRFIEDQDNQSNKEASTALIPFANFTLTAMFFGRIVLLIASFRWPALCKSFYFF